MEKEVKLQYAGKEEIFIIKKLTFGEKNRLREEVTDVKVLNGQQLVKIDTTKLIENSIFKSLVKAPFPITLQNIQDLDAELGEQLLDAVQEYNNLDEKKKLN